MAQPLSATLPKEYDNHLRLSLRYLDDRKYEKVHGELNQITRKFPDHAEALAVKALAVQQQQLETEGAKKTRGAAAAKAAEAAKLEVPTENPFDIAKKALASDFKCVIAWHAMGTLHRNDKNNAEALKAYRQAFRVEEKLGSWPDGTTRLNLNLLRDVTTAAIQQRDWPLLVEVRQRALSLKSTVRANWITYCVAHYMSGNVELASAIADTVCKIMDAGDNSPERNEIMLFRAQLKLEVNRPTEAIPILNGTVKGEEVTAITDKSEKNKLLARAYVASKQKQLAQAKINELLAARDSERDMLYLLAQSNGIKLEPVIDAEGGAPREVTPSPEFVELLDAAAATHKKCDAARRLALDYCSAVTDSAGFEQRVIKYIKPYVKNFVPSLVTVLESLYVSREKVAILEKTFLGWQKMLEAGDESAFQDGADEKKENGNGGAAAAATAAATTRNPCLILSVYEFLAAHFRLKGDCEQAHKYIDKAIAHTPTYEMLYLAKARICNAQGNHKEAATLADTAQRLDLQDKYLNNKAAQYLIRSGDIETAEKRMALFFKTSTQPDAYLQSFELQYTWYEKELGAAYLARGDFPSALQAFTLIDKHQQDNHEELADFHNYALRRNNLRQWVDIIKTEDDFSGTNHFLDACPWIVRCYLGIWERLRRSAGGDDNGKAKAMSKEEVDKILFSEEAGHVPRPKLQYEDEAEQKRMDKFAAEYWDLSKLDMTDPLQKAAPYAAALVQHRKNSLEAHEISFELNFAAGRSLQCASAVAHMHRIAREHRVPGGRGVVNVEKSVSEVAAKLEGYAKRLASMVGGIKDARVKELVEAAAAKFKTAEVVADLKKWLA